jgi:microfibrillar-associated protein 1
MNSKEHLKSLIKYKKEESKLISAPIVHRKGQKPSWVEEESDDDIFQDDEDEVQTLDNLDDEKLEIDANEYLDQGKLEKIEKEDPRLKRLAIENIKGDENERLKFRREIYKSEIMKKTNATNEDIPSIDENKQEIIPKSESQVIDLSRRREIMKSSIVQANKPEPEEEDELLQLIGGDDEENEGKKDIQEESSLDEESIQEEEEEEEILMRPVFVSKEDRLTLNEQLQREKEEKEVLEQQQRMKEIKKRQTKEIVKKYIQEEENKETEVVQDSEDQPMPDDTDNLDDLVEYENWKLRELRRIKIQFQEDEKKLKERLEIDRRRNLTDDQRKEENMRLGSDDTLKPFKSKLNFLQKFYHKGVFFQQEAKEDLSHIYNRDYNLPTWEDKIDRSNLPKILQVRRGLQFKKGRSKYTHLTSEDTTNFDPTYKVPDFISNKNMTNLGGYKAQNDFDLTKKKRQNN